RLPGLERGCLDAGHRDGLGRAHRAHRRRCGGEYVEDAANGRRAVDEPLVRAETAEGLAAPRTAFGWIVAGLRERRRRGVPAFTVLCCDNIQGKGVPGARPMSRSARRL